MHGNLVLWSFVQCDALVSQINLTENTGKTQGTRTSFFPGQPIAVIKHEQVDLASMFILIERSVHVYSCNLLVFIFRSVILDFQNFVIGEHSSDTENSN